MSFVDSMRALDLAVKLTMGLYGLSGLLNLGHSMRRKYRFLRWAALALLGAGLLVNAVWLMNAWHELGHPPFSENFGCLVLLAMCVAVVSLSLDVTVNIRFLGGLTTLTAGGVLVFGARFVGEVRPLMPALQSVYFAPHVLGYFIAYGALSVSAVASAVLLVVRLLQVLRVPTGAGFLDGVRAWIERSALIGMPFLTLGIVLGALWAQASGGDYWSWDPKEVWALITWLFVVAWFHLWRIRSRGVLSAVVMLVAVGALYFTFLGLGLLPTAGGSYHLYTKR